MYVCMYVCMYPQVMLNSPTHISVSRGPWPPPRFSKSTVGGGTALTHGCPPPGSPPEGGTCMYIDIYIYIYCQCPCRCIPLLLRHADFFVGVALASNGVRQSYRQGSAPAASLCLPSTCRAAPLLLPPLFALPGCTYMFFSPLCQSPAFQGRRVLTQHPTQHPLGAPLHRGASPFPA